MGQLQVQNQWQQKVKDRSGKEYELTCTIADIKKDKGLTVYTILYQDKNSDYYEKREIKEKTGITSFERSWKDREGNTVILSYRLYEKASGYAK